MPSEFYQCPVYHPYSDTKVWQGPSNDHDTQVLLLPNQLPLQMDKSFCILVLQNAFSVAYSKILSSQY